MKNKLIILSLILILIIIAIISGIYMYKLNNIAKTEVNNTKTLAQVSDECTDEYAESIKNIATINTNFQEEKITPNTNIIIEKFYKKCSHIIKEKKIVSENLINMNKEELQKEYPKYDIKIFSTKEVCLYIEVDEYCNEHYIVKDENDFISIYEIDENKNLKLKEKTNISTKLLPDADKIYLKNGIQIYGKENLNKAIEDYE